MPASLKRKGSPDAEDAVTISKRRLAPSDNAPPPEPTDTEAATSAADDETAAPLEDTPSAVDLPTDRAARFAALRARNQAGRKSNLHETKSEARRSAVDPTALTALTRRKDIAAHKLLKADTEDAGEDFERKRAWDWTVEESERWDARLAEKARKREEGAFQNYAAEAGKVYERQVGMLEKSGMEERLAAYQEEKREAIERAVRSGGCEIVEAEDGELIAVGKDGTFLSTAENGVGFAESQRPKREAVDRLVADIKSAEEVRLKKRKERGRADDDGGDVTYINEKNKQFNQKLARFYNKYTADIRESFERGTAI